jgi:hypothetical protein
LLFRLYRQRRCPDIDSPHVRFALVTTERKLHAYHLPQALSCQDFEATARVVAGKVLSREIVM